MNDFNADLSKALTGTQHLLTHTIRQAVEEFGCEPVDINGGRCDEFAEHVLSKLGDDSGVRHEIFYGKPNGTHSYLKFDGRYYDAEAPEGVSSVYKLPVVDRWVRSVRKQGQQ